MRLFTVKLWRRKNTLLMMWTYFCFLTLNILIRDYCLLIKSMNFNDKNNYFIVWTIKVRKTHWKTANNKKQAKRRKYSLKSAVWLASTISLSLSFYLSIFIDLEINCTGDSSLSNKSNSAGKHLSLSWSSSLPLSLLHSSAGKLQGVFFSFNCLPFLKLEIKSRINL